MARTPVLNLGVCGLGPDWETRYGPAIARLGNRARIGGVFDVTAAHADRIARAVGAAPLHGVREFLEARPLDAILLLHVGWHGDWLIQAVAGAGLPLFIGQNVALSQAVFQSLLRQSATQGGLVVPERPLRYHPSILRLRELMATQLGPARTIRLSLPAARSALESGLTLVDLLSWSRVTFDLITPEARDIQSESAPPPAPGLLSLHALTRNRREIHLELQSDEQDHEARSGRRASVPPFCTVVCESGRVDLLGPRDLRWEAGEGARSETLAGDRSATDVLVDLFARRAVGGLIPVPDLTDLDHGLRLAALLERVER